MVVFSGVWYQQAVEDAEQAVRERVYESNLGFLVMVSVEEELRNYYQIIAFRASQQDLKTHKDRTEFRL